jgi:hypothetical protein
VHVTLVFVSGEAFDVDGEHPSANAGRGHKAQYSASTAADAVAHRALERAPLARARNARSFLLPTLDPANFLFLWIRQSAGPLLNLQSGTTVFIYLTK